MLLRTDPRSFTSQIISLLFDFACWAWHLFPLRFDYDNHNNMKYNRISRVEKHRPCALKYAL